MLAVLIKTFVLSKLFIPKDTISKTSKKCIEIKQEIYENNHFVQAYISTYDKLGNVQSRACYGKNDSLMSINYTNEYDSTNKLSKVTSYSMGFISGITYFYPNGKHKEIQWFNADNEMIGDYEYNEKGKLVKSRLSNHYTSIKNESKNTINGSISSQSASVEQEEIERSYFYNNKDSLIRVLEQNYKVIDRRKNKRANQKQIETNYFYNNQQLLVKIIEDKDYEIGENITLFNYDKKNRISIKTEKCCKTYYLYNDNHQLIREKQVYLYNGSFTEILFEYNELSQKTRKIKGALYLPENVYLQNIMEEYNYYPNGQMSHRKAYSVRNGTKNEIYLNYLEVFDLSGNMIESHWMGEQGESFQETYTQYECK